MKRITKANQTSAAIHNRTLAIELLRQFGPLSRRQLAQITGLRTSTLTYIVRDLIEQNIVRTVGKAESKTVGKKQILLEINPDKGWVVGMGIETTQAKFVYTDAAGNVIDRQQVEVSPNIEMLPDVLHKIITTWAQNCQKQPDDLLGIGVGLSGVVDNVHGRIVRSRWYDTEDLPLRDMIAEHFDTTIIIDKDVNCAALAESRIGSAKGMSNFVYLLMNTLAKDDKFSVPVLGITFFLDGRLYRGSCYAAGEVDLQLGAGCFTSLTQEQIRFMADPEAPLSDVMQRLARQTARTLTPIVDLMDPQAVVLGGNLVIRNKRLIDEVQREVNLSLIKVPNRHVSISMSELMGNGISMGAAIAALESSLIGDDSEKQANEQEQMIQQVLRNTLDDPV